MNFASSPILYYLQIKSCTVDLDSSDCIFTREATVFGRNNSELFHCVLGVHAVVFEVQLASTGSVKFDDGFQSFLNRKGLEIGDV